MEIILLRHGKAEKITSEMIDVDRELTSSGRRELKDAVPGLALYIEPTFHLHVWTSPLPRARQTARLVAEGLGHAPVTERQEIAKGNLEELAFLWEKMDNKDVIIVVGHEPYLSEWCTRLTGAAISFKTASAAGIEIKEPKILQGKLRWFAHPSVLARLGKS